MPTYRNLLPGLLMTVVSSYSCFAQSTVFGLASGSGAPGTVVTLDISMNTASGVTPSSVEWTLNYPANDFSGVSVTPGSVAAAANKSVSCTNAAGSETCVLWGENSTAMPNGVVASVALTVSGTTQDAFSQVQLSVPVAADSLAFPLTTSATGGTVTILQPAALSGFWCAPGSVAPPASSMCTLNLSSAAPSGGASVSIGASQADVIVPVSVSIPAGGNSATFLANPVTVGSTTPITLSASYGGASQGFGLTVNPPAVYLTSIGLGATTLVSPLVASGSVTLSAPAGPGGASVPLSSSNILAVLVPPSVFIAPGATTATFSFTTVSVLEPTNVVIIGSYGGANVTTNLGVIARPHPLSSLTFASNTLQSGQSTTGVVSLSAPAGSGGVLIQLFSANAGILSVPAYVTIPQGALSAPIQATAGTVMSNTQVAITAYHAGLQQTAFITVRPR